MTPVSHRLGQDPLHLERHHGVLVAREDLVEGGAKMRFLPYLVAGAKSVVFGGPFCGGAPYALSVYGRHTGTPVHLFFARRRRMHRRQLAEIANGAHLHLVPPPAYMTVVQARARAFAESTGARFLPLGFDVPAAVDPFVRFLRGSRPALERDGPIDQIWCATGSGMLARTLGAAFPDIAVHGVVVGLASRNEAQNYGPNVRLHRVPWKFEQEVTFAAPFPSCPNYDRKAWLLCKRIGRGRRLFWNVLG